MKTPKDLAIQKIEKEFETLSNLVLEQLQYLNEVLRSEKKANLEKVMLKIRSNEEEIDQYEVRLDEQIIRAIVLHHPIATDLRRLFAIYHMTINLERVGDLVLNIACIQADIKDGDILEESASAFQNMLKITSKMVSKALLSFVNNDAEYARWTLNKNLEFDEINRKLLKKSIKSAGLPRESKRVLNNLVDVRAIISSLERIGDNATNIAESSYYAITGSNIRHQKTKTEN